MKTSEQIEKVSDALVHAQAAVGKALKDGKNTFFKTANGVAKYATLDSVIEACKQPLKDNHLAVLQAPSFDNGQFIVTTRIVHSSGQFYEITTPCLFQKQDMQGYGSAITYAKRYALSSLLNIATEEDDDGNKTTNNDQDSRLKANKDFAENKAKQNLPKKPEDFFINVGKNKGKKIGDLDKKQIEDMLITMNAYYSKEENKKDLKAAQPLIDAANDHLMSLIEQEQKQNFNNI